MTYDKNTKGYIYILTNPAYPNDMLKIGMTRRTPEVRAREIYKGATGVPAPFKVAFKKHVENCELAEKILHKRLLQFRSNNSREFFELELKEAKIVLNEVAYEIDELYSQEKIRKASASIAPNNIRKVKSSGANQKITKPIKSDIIKPNLAAVKYRTDESKQVNINETEVKIKTGIRWWHWLVLFFIAKAVYIIGN